MSRCDDDALGRSRKAQLAKALIAQGARATAAVARAAFELAGALEGLEITPDRAYGSDPRQRYEVWRPTRPAMRPRPLVLFLHGGGFQHLDRASHWAFAERFARAGAVVLSADYRLAPAHPYPAAAEDAALLYRHALREAARLGADARALVVAGTSAGANLALGLAITEAGAEGPRACVLFSGLLQVSDIARLYRARRVHPLLRARIASIACEYVGTESAWQLPERPDPRLDPLPYLERAERVAPEFPAVFCSTGSRDTVLEDALRLGNCLHRLGVTSEIDVLPGFGHAFQGFVFSARIRSVWERCVAFLRARGLQLESARSS